MPSSSIAVFRASNLDSLQMISTLVNLGEVPSAVSKEGTRLTGMASAVGTLPVTATGASVSTAAVSGSIAKPA